ncbi:MULTISPECIES: glycoside hydrolase family 3 N-terminal domain-containing protein [unclassified Caulobacter]|uniref:glycoside hydrolase family 3 N-terminal domain-containing protein n=1 Tax=unclassified Caulobacter TaxID=2648921 RepID=UPI0006F7F645|nr:MULTISPECIES: glycoside hydrolase family 3 N-terminal domain-containing protein [unclassified Caulobacter]KQV55880.1 glycoside hydrolase [Caulobacter sp. Root342]KQV70946.1 glycoside hydrolase [Caulobacter sp. Root343]
MTTTITRRLFGASLAALSAAALPGASFAADKAPKKAGDKPLYKDPTQPIDARVQDLLGRMTLEEKAAQLIGIWLTKAKIQTPEGDFSPEEASKNFPNGLGQISRPTDRRGLKPATVVGAAAGAEDGSIGRNAPQTAKYTNAAQKWAVEKTRLGIPLLMHDEALHGYVARDATSFPQAIALASTFDPELAEKIFSVAAREMRARGSNMALAPVVDVARDPRWGRIEETYGEDPHVCAEMGLAAIRGFQGATLPLAKDKVFATLKHMTGHGQPENGTNVGPAQIAERTLRENFFPPFERAVTELPVRSVMPSYNEIDGVPSHANHWLLTKILREEWGYKGSVQSDYFAIKELIARHKLTNDLGDTAVMALHAGVDVELPDGEAYALIPELVKAGRIPQFEVDAAVARVLTMKFEGGFFENPYCDEKTADAKTATPDAVALAREAARKAVVLLKNDKSLLPLDGKKIKRLALLGTHAKDTPIGGYSDVPRHVVSLHEGLTAEAKAQGFQLDYAEAVRITEKRIWAQDEVKFVDPAVNAKLIAEAVEVAKNADVVLMVLGDNEQTSREAWADNHLGDRDSLDLIGQQNDLAKAIFDLGKPTVVFLLNGRPLSINLLAQRADAIIEGWYLGQETGNAAADILFGRANPGGKLPVSIARDVGQLPIYYNRKPTARRGYLGGDTSPLYPFGFGLSYTTFDISAPRLAKARIGQGESTKVEIDVVNTGKLAGDEVVQLYIHDEAASVTRPVLELKHFKRVTLAPGAKTTVTFEIKPSDLWMWNLDMKRVVEPGDFSILVGPNSVDLKKATLTVA